MSRRRWLAGNPGDLSVLDHASSSNDFVYVTCSSDARSHAGLTLIANLRHQSHLLLIPDMCTDASEDLLLWRDDRDRS